MATLTSAERTLAKRWSYGSPVATMLAMQDAGSSQAEREAFLRKIGVTESGLDSMEVHRDSYLAWYRAEVLADIEWSALTDRVMEAS